MESDVITTAKMNMNANKLIIVMSITWYLICINNV